MTREEAKQIIEYAFLNADWHLEPNTAAPYTAKDIINALRIAIDALSHPQLPSDKLEERLEEINKKGLESAHTIDFTKQAENSKKILQKREQPCEELEAEIERVLEDLSFRATINSGGFTTTVLDYPKIAKHFYELGNRSHWKPSEEQIECLRKTLAKETGYERTILRSLFQELITLL